MAVLNVYGLSSSLSGLNCRAFFRTLLPQQSKLWFSFYTALQRTIEGAGKCWVILLREKKKKNHLSPLMLRHIYRDAVNVSALVKKTSPWKLNDGKKKPFFPPCSVRLQSPFRGQVCGIFTSARGVRPSERQLQRKVAANGDYEVLMETATAGIHHGWCRIAPFDLQTHVRCLQQSHRGSAAFFTVGLMLFRSHVWTTDYNLMIAGIISRKYTCATFCLHYWVMCLF